MSSEEATGATGDGLSGGDQRGAHGGRYSRSRRTLRDAAAWPGATLFDHIARTVCAAGCLPRKELFESWEVARRIRRRFRGGRVVDLACGHALLARLLLVLDDSSPEAVAVDRRLPECASRLAEAFDAAWPRLHGRVELRQGRLEEVALASGDLVVSAHACGDLTDSVLDRATAAGARVAVLPCCQRLERPARSSLEGWLDGPLAVDVARAVRLEAAGYSVFTSSLPLTVTAKNRLLLGQPGPNRAR